MRFPVPDPYVITQAFSSGHLGIDIAPTPAGTKNRPVVAPEKSIVVASGNNPALEGIYLILKGDSGKFYYFGHFASVNYLRNQGMNEGDVIGLMGMTGLATGIHTHHEVRTTISGGQINPYVYYSNVKGEDMLIPDQDNYYARYGQDLATKLRGRQLSREEFRKYIVGQTDLRAIEILSDDPEAAIVQNWQNVGKVAVQDKWDSQIYSLIDRVKQLEGQQLVSQEELDKLAKMADDLEQAIKSANK